MRLSEVHNKAILASLDCRSTSSWTRSTTRTSAAARDVPAHRRDADQDEAVIRAQEAKEAVEEYGELFFTDRYGLDARVEVDVEH